MSIRPQSIYSTLTTCALFLLASAPAWATTAISEGVESSGLNQSAVPMGGKTLQFSFSSAYSWGKFLDVETLNAADSTWVDNDKFARLDMGIGVAYGVFDFLDASLFVPYYQDSDPAGETFSGMGDLRLSLKLNYPPYEHNRAFELAYLLSFDLPTGNGQTDGGFARNPWVANRRVESIEYPGYYQRASGWTPYGAGNIVTTGKLLMTANFAAVEGMVPLLLHLNFGMSLSGKEYENAFLLGGGADFWFTPNVGLSWAAEGDMDISHATKHIQVTKYPISHKLGLLFAVPQAHLTATVGVNLVTNKRVDRDFNWGECADTVDPAEQLGCENGSIVDVEHADDIDYVFVNPNAPASGIKYARTPSFGVFGGISFGVDFSPRDTDGDGLIDEKDYCPVEPEDADGFEDEDGCPEKDNDQDGVADAADKCPDQAEDADGFQDEDGCPEKDNDRDGVEDAQDKCPNDMEDKDGFDDEDGCADLDNDQDGVTDNFDKCPIQAEDMDSFEDADGCPDLDNDRDGIPDELDKCPDKAEVINGIKDSDGCPD